MNIKRLIIVYRIKISSNRSNYSPHCVTESRIKKMNKLSSLYRHNPKHLNITSFPHLDDTLFLDSRVALLDLRGTGKTDTEAERSS